MVGLSRAEALALAKASGLGPEEFTVNDRVGPRALDYMVRMDPVFAMMMPNGQRTRLRVSGDGACFFLGENGCALPRENKPLFCRLYPFWFKSGGDLAVWEAPHCLALQQSAGLGDAMRLLGASLPNLWLLYKRFLGLAGLF